MLASDPRCRQHCSLETLGISFTKSDRSLLLVTFLRVVSCIPLLRITRRGRVSQQLAQP